MNHASFNYVRTFRQRHALSEDELAFLINQRSHTVVSRIEIGRRVPNVEGALALQVLFRQQPRQMFPGLFDVVEEGVMRRGKALLDQLGNKSDPRSNAKREFLEGLAREEDSDNGV